MDREGMTAFKPEAEKVEDSTKSTIEA